MILQPDGRRSRLMKYAPFTNPVALGLDRWSIFDANLDFISDTENIIFRADTSDHSYCVRIYPDQSCSVPEIYGELFWLLDLRHNTNLVVPHPLRTSSGHFVYDAFIPEFEASFHVVLFHWLPGNIIGSDLDTDVAKCLGRSMADLHTHASSFDLPTDSFRDVTDWRGMGHFLANLTPTQISRIESFLTIEQLDLCEQAAQDVAKIINKVDDLLNFGLIHNDLHSNNCLFLNGQIGIIDFDDCQFAPFTCDMAVTISSFDSFPQHNLLRSAFLQGYAENRDLPPNYIKEIEAFRVERRLRLIRWVSTWTSVDRFSFGWRIIENSLKYIRQRG